MSFITPYLVDPVTIIWHGAENDLGEQAPETTTDVMGYVEWKTRLVRNLQGEQVVAAAGVLLEYDANLSHKEKIRIASVDHSILAIEPAKDFENVGIWVYIA